MSKHNMPSEANSIIEEILKLVEAVESLRRSWIQDGLFGTSTEEDKSEFQEYIDLYCALNDLPYRWCGVELKDFGCYLKIDRARRYFLFAKRLEKVSGISPVSGLNVARWPAGKKVRSSDRMTVVPKELWETIDRFAAKCPRPGLFSEHLLTDVYYSLSSLKRTIATDRLVKIGPQTISRTPRRRAGPGDDNPVLVNEDRTLIVSGKEYDFTKAQAPIIRVLFDNYVDGNQFISEGSILEKAGRPDATFASLFKSRKKKKEWHLLERNTTHTDLWRLKLD